MTYLILNILFSEFILFILRKRSFIFVYHFYLLLYFPLLILAFIIFFSFWSIKWKAYSAPNTPFLPTYKKHSVSWQITVSSNSPTVSRNAVSFKISMMTRFRFRIKFVLVIYFLIHSDRCSNKICFDVEL